MSPFHDVMSFIAILVVVSSYGHAYDPPELQDFCVAVKDSDAKVFVNGKICKDPTTVTAADFSYAGLDKPGNITSPLGSKLTQVFINQLPGLNTLGIALVRLDFAPFGHNPPHLHPRASEILLVLEGTIYTGFITSNPADPDAKPRLFAKVLYPGEVFLFPKGLIHFQYNVGNESAVAISAFNSQNPGVATMGRGMFWSDPSVYPEVLAKGFQVDEKLVKHLQSLPWKGNN